MAGPVPAAGGRGYRAAPSWPLDFWAPAVRQQQQECTAAAAAAAAGLGRLGSGGGTRRGHRPPAAACGGGANRPGGQHPQAAAPNLHRAAGVSRASLCPACCLSCCLSCGEYRCVRCHRLAGYHPHPACNPLPAPAASILPAIIPTPPVPPGLPPASIPPHAACLPGHAFRDASLGPDHHLSWIASCRYHYGAAAGWQHRFWVGGVRRVGWWVQAGGLAIGRRPPAPALPAGLQPGWPPQRAFLLAPELCGPAAGGQAACPWWLTPTPPASSLRTLPQNPKTPKPQNPVMLKFLS